MANEVNDTAAKAHLEAALVEYFKKKTVEAEAREAKRHSEEDALATMEELGITDYHFEIEEEGETQLIVIEAQTKQTKKLNKDTLAEALSVEKADLDTPGMIELSNSGELTPAIYNENVDTEIKTKAKIRKRKKREKKARK